jgi:sigma-B regulation protein RsbU (phosphoserine phosphatase)
VDVLGSLLLAIIVSGLRFPLKTAVRLAVRKVRPASRTAWFTVYVAGLELLLLALKYSLKLLGNQQAAAALDGWSAFLLSLICGLLLFLGFRWFRNFILWRLRNRLIVTYLFIGGVPVFLVVLMALIAGYFVGGEFATFLTVSEIQAQLQELQTANSASAQQIAHSNKAREPAEVKMDETVFPGGTILVLPEAARPKWLKDSFKGLVMDQGEVCLRAASVVKAGNEQVVVVSSAPVNQKFLARIAAGLGPITLYLPPKETGNNLTFSHGTGVEINGKPSLGISAGSLPEPQFRGDRALNYYAFIQLAAWNAGPTGGATDVLMVGSIRLSTLYSRLSVSVSEWANTIRNLLTGLAITFGVIVLIALLIGIRLTRTITRSVANLYKATEHINRGDFTHRIPVKERDQLAALQAAFNSMTESLEKLIVEQKEKERLQSELEIAHEVQAQLFPKAVSGSKTLELCGVCRPARIVSGDYYDFLPYGSEQMGIAVGDISGKGISAALLMATIHSAVRAYEHEQLIAVTASHTSLQTARSGSVGLAVRNSPPQSPSQVLWLLNRQLYKTTQPEKYATLFLGFYDGHTRQLTYSNAGHLPPLILGEDGSLRRLETGGTVVGLFDNIEYEESTVKLLSGDIFIAFSDGITEPENEFGEFGEERLIETIEAHRNLPLDRIADNVIAAVQDWIGSAEQPDDLTVVLAKARDFN